MKRKKPERFAAARLPGFPMKDLSDKEYHEDSGYFANRSYHASKSSTFRFAALRWSQLLAM